MLRKRLPGCTCSYSTTAPAARRLCPVPSTSSRTLDEPEPLSGGRFFDSLLPDDRQLPLARPPPKKSGKRFNRRLQHSRQIQHLPTTPSHPSPDPLPRSASTSSSLPSKISPYLPLVTRERSYLLANLRACLYSSPNDQAPPPNPEQTWRALAAVLQYPDQLPDLPPTQHSTTTRSSDPDDPEAPLEPRTKIQISLLELRRCFTVVASERPRTRNGLQRLLVVAELMALKSDSGKAAIAAANLSGGGGMDGGRDEPLKELRGGGENLREKDWRTLMLFAGANLRAPRATVDVQNSFSLFSHLQRVEEEKRSFAGRLGQGEFVAEKETYNALLHVACRANAWEVVEHVEQRMRALGVEGDVHTVGVKLRKEHHRGAHIETVWNVFEQGLQRWSSEGGTDRLWNMMLWVYAERGMLDEAMGLYRAMRAGRPVNLLYHRPPDHGYYHHSPHPSSYSYRPFDIPPPDLATYTALIQAFTYRGDLRSALSIMHDMVSPPPYQPHLTKKTPTIHVFTCLFRGFATHGLLPPSSGLPVSPLLLRGPTQRANARANRESSFAALAKLGSTSTTDNRGIGVSSSASLWTLPSLQVLFSSFLALAPPPPSSITSSTPFRGARLSPQSNDLFWLLTAFEVLTGDDSRVVLSVWDAVVDKFGRGGRIKGVRGVGWTGWKLDKRVVGMLERHRRRVVEWEQEDAALD